MNKDFIYEEQKQLIEMWKTKYYEQKDEIERLQRQKEELQVNGLRQETLFKLEIERLHSIIKEVREYIEEIEKADNYIFKMGFNDILEILDKGE